MHLLLSLPVGMAVLLAVGVAVLLAVGGAVLLAVGGAVLLAVGMLDVRPAPLTATTLMVCSWSHCAVLTEVQLPLSSLLYSMT